MPSLLKPCAAALAVAILTTGHARAQEPGPPERRDFEQAMAERRAQEAQDLRTVLRLRSDQEAAFAAFQAALVAPRPPLAGRPKALTTPELLADMDRRAAEHEAGREKHVKAVRALYAALSPEQQQVFDAIQRLRAPIGPPPPFGSPGPDRILRAGPPDLP